MIRQQIMVLVSLAILPALVFSQTDISPSAEDVAVSDGRTIDMAFYGHQMTADVPLSHQERAYTSPIWYTP